MPKLYFVPDMHANLNPVKSFSTAYLYTQAKFSLTYKFKIYEKKNLCSNYAVCHGIKYLPGMGIQP